MSSHLSFREKLGRCQRCIRLSLALAAAFWVALAVAWALGPGAVTLVAGAVATGFTGLVAAHGIAFLVRRGRTPPAPCGACGHASGPVSRRSFVRGAGLGLGAAAAWLAGMRGPSRASAADDKKRCADGRGFWTIESDCLHDLPADYDWSVVEASLVSQAQAQAEGAAKKLCEKPCKPDPKRCTMVHYDLTWTVARQECQAGGVVGVKLVLTAAITAHCRCLPRECVPTNLAPPLVITARACADTLAAACQAALAALVPQVADAAARACGGECGAGSQDKCTVKKVEVKYTPKPVKAPPGTNQKCCEVTATITKVGCDCD